MKIVKNYKGLKKWAKMLFVALLTICIVFTTTGIGTLIAYADECTAGGEHEAAASQWLPDDNNTHSYYTKCAKCHENLSVENSEPHVFDGYEEKDVDSHYKLCSKCGARIEEAHTDSGDGTCVCGYAMNPAADPPTDPVPDCSNGHTHDDNTQYDHPSSTEHSYVCTVCGQTVREYCTFENGVCTVCGAQEPVRSGSSRGLSLGAPLRTAANGQNTLANPGTISESDFDYLRYVDDYFSGDGATHNKPEFFRDHVSIFVTDPYMICTNIDYSTDPPTFHSAASSYRYNVAGFNQTIQLMILKNGATAADREYFVLTIPGINIVQTEAVAPSGTITIGTVTSTDAAPATYNPSEKKVTVTEPSSITINATDTSGIKSIGYYISEGFIANPSSIIPSTWSTYDNANKPKTLSGKDCYVYAKITDNNDNVSYRAFGKVVLNSTSETTGTSTGKIIIDDYESNKVAATNELVYATKELERIKIEASNATSGVDTIEYATSEEVYYTVSDITGAVIDGKMRWKPYSDTGRPTIPANKASYIYARIKDNDGGYTYLSTGKVIHDNMPPVITNGVLVEKPQDGTSSGSSTNSGTTATLTNNNSNKSTTTEHLLVVTGKDTLIGIDKFYMVYEEKTKDSKIPTVDEVIARGAVADVETRDGENAGASFPLSGLYSDKTYNFHIVAVDKLGNKSVIKTITTKGKGMSSKDASGNSIDNGSGGSGLAPAPNGIAGSGGAAAAGGSGSGSGSGKSGLEAAPNGIAGSGSGSALDREINRKPYISDATGNTKIGLEATGGWDKITQEVTGAQEGTSIKVEMAGLSVVPDRVLGAMRGRNVSVKFQLPQDVEWQVNGQDIDNTSGADINMGVIIGARNIPLDMLDAVTGSYPHTEIELKHDGPLGFTGKLRVPLGESNSGMYAYLYYYDTEAQEMVLIQSAQVDSTGYAEFDFDHASDYTIVLRPGEMMGAGDKAAADAAGAEDAEGLAGATSISGSDVAYSTFTMNDAVGNSASVRIWLFAVAIISALLCGAILFMPGLQLREAE